jgi:catechol 2,3-dioxygenase-like lactoylglutathione lyase family enzyme
MNTQLGSRLRGLSHLALNCRDMAATVEFYAKLGIPLIKTTLTGPDGQHFFFDIGNGDAIAYFYWGDNFGERSGTPAVPGQEHYDGAMHHVAMEIAPEDVQAWADHLTELEIPFGLVMHRTDGVSYYNDLSHMHDDDIWCISFYFAGPDNEQLEVAAWMPAFETMGVEHTGMSSSNPLRKVTYVPEMIRWTLPKPAEVSA